MTGNECGLVSFQNMKDNLNNGIERSRAAVISFFLAVGRALRAGVEKVVPLGYEDESGFHIETGDARID
jgi:hypothetical protein